LDSARFLGTLKIALGHFEKIGEDTSVYRKALAQIGEGITKKVPAQKMAAVLGNGIKAQEAVPMAIYCFLANRDSLEKAVEAAIFLGGDTDTIASMTASISGAALGEKSIPERWLRRVTEIAYTSDKVRQIAFELYRKGKTSNFKDS
jgi:ADP-ribosylglycohydrolase